MTSAIAAAPNVGWNRAGLSRRPNPWSAIAHNPPRINPPMAMTFVVVSKSCTRPPVPTPWQCRKVAIQSSASDRPFASHPCSSTIGITLNA